MGEYSSRQSKGSDSLMPARQTLYVAAPGTAGHVRRTLSWSGCGVAVRPRVSMVRSPIASSSTRRGAPPSVSGFAQPCTQIVTFVW